MREIRNRDRVSNQALYQSIAQPLSYFLKEDLPQSYWRHINGAGVEIVRAFYNGVDIPAGDHHHLMATASDVFDPCDSKVTFWWHGRKEKIDSPVRLPKIIQGSVQHHASSMEHADMIGDTLNFRDLMR